MESSAEVSLESPRRPVLDSAIRWRVWTLVHATWLLLALSAFGEETPKVAVHLEIRDELTGSDLEVSIRRNATVGTKGIDFMDEVVDMESRRYPGVGVFVTSLCGVEAPKGTFWALTIDGERAKKGISELSIERPIRIGWELVKMDSEERPGKERDRATPSATRALQPYQVTGL